MKKLFAILLIITLLIPSFAISSYAASGDAITEAEAKKLVWDAYDFYKHVRLSYFYGYITPANPTPEEVLTITYDKDQYYNISSGLAIRYLYLLEEKLPGGSYEGMTEYAKTIYAEDIAEFAYKYIAGTNMPLFYTDEQGNRRVAGSLIYSYLRDYGYSLGYFVEDSQDIELTLTSNDTAKIRMRFNQFDEGEMTPDGIDEVECKFVKTESGWRIASSEFTILMFEDKHSLCKHRDYPSTDWPSNSTLRWTDALHLSAYALQLYCDVRLAYTSGVIGEGEMINVEVGGKTLQYSPVVAEKLPGGSFEGLEEYAKTIYTSDIAANAYKYGFGENGENIPLFYKDSAGKLYARPGMEDGKCGFNLFTDSPGDLTVTVKDPSNVYIILIEGDNDSAIGYVELIFEDAVTGEKKTENVWCNFVKTADGWRIAESELTVLLSEGVSAMYEYRAKSPATADVEYQRVIALSLTALTALIPAALVVRKRRKYSCN